MNIIKNLINIITNIKNNHKEQYMLSIEAMSHKRTHMGMGIIAITNNKVDIMFVIMGVCALIMYIAYMEVRRYMRTRTMRGLMRTCMHDYSYSSALVRMMDKEG